MRAIKIRSASFTFLQKGQYGWEITDSTIAISIWDIDAIVDHIEKHRLRVFNIYDLGEDDTEILKQMKNVKAFTIIPIYKERDLIGLLSIGKRVVRNHLLAEEEEMLIMLINQNDNYF